MLKVGLIGCGFMGTMHANCYKILDGVTLAAVADIRADKAKDAANGTDAVIYGDGLDLIKNADVDIIDICLPTYLHASYALAAMDKAKYVFVEKPVTFTGEEADALIKKSEETGCKVQVGLVLPYENEYSLLTKTIKEGQYGKVISANFRRLSPRPEWGWENWLLDVNKSGGAAQDLHIHDLDYALFLFGKPEKMYSVKNRLGEENSYINTLLSYSDKVVTIEGTWDLPATYPFEASYRVVFEKAVLEFANGKVTLFTKDSATNIDVTKQDLGEDSYKGGNVSDLSGYYNELLYFTNRAKEGAEIEKSTLKMAANSLKFLLEELAFEG